MCEECEEWKSVKSINNFKSVKSIWTGAYEEEDYNGRDVKDKSQIVQQSPL